MCPWELVQAWGWPAPAPQHGAALLVPAFGGCCRAQPLYGLPALPSPSCSFSSCRDPACSLCKNIPHKACTDAQQLCPKYVVRQQLAAPCGGALRLALGGPCAAAQWAALRAAQACVRMLLVDERKRQEHAKRLLLQGASSASNAQVAALLAESVVAFDPAVSGLRQSLSSSRRAVPQCSTSCQLQSAAAGGAAAAPSAAEGVKAAASPRTLRIPALLRPALQGQPMLLCKGQQAEPDGSLLLSLEVRPAGLLPAAPALPLLMLSAPARATHVPQDDVAAGVSLSGLSVGCSTERATAGRKRAPVRLAAVLVDATGAPLDAAPLLSPEFYVVSDRAENHEGMGAPLLMDSPVSQVRTIGAPGSGMGGGAGGMQAPRRPRRARPSRRVLAASAPQARRRCAG